MPSVSIRFPDELLSAIRESAESSRRSLNSEVLVAIDFYLQHAREAQSRAAPKEGPDKPKRSK